MTALAGLDKVKWAKLETVEGTAAKAPAVLKSLASGDAKKATQGVQWLFSEVLHQSMPAPSAITFVPFLIELVALKKQPARWELLALLGDLACGGDHRPFILGGNPAAGNRLLHAAVAKGHETYAAFLGDPSAKVRSAAAFVLAFLPKPAKATRTALSKASASEKDSTARASMALALAVLDRNTTFANAHQQLTKVKTGDALCWEHGNVKKLRARLGKHLGIDDAAAAEVPAKPSTLDVEVTVARKTKPFRAHLADAVKTPAMRKPLAAAFANGRTPSEVVDACIDSVALGLTGEWAQTIVELLDACDDAIIPVLRTVDVYRSVKRADGLVVTTQQIGLPILLVLGRRDKAPPKARLEVLLNTVSLTRDVDVDWFGPMLVEALRALAPKLRKPLVDHLRRNCSNERAQALLASV